MTGRKEGHAWVLGDDKTLLPFHPPILPLLSHSLVRPDAVEPNIIVHSLKLLEEVSRFLQRPAAKDEDVQEAIGLWESLLEGPLEGVLQHSTPFLRACACDCLAAVGSAGFAGLQVGRRRGARRALSHTVALANASSQLVFPSFKNAEQSWKQRHIPVLLLGMCHDGAPPVRAASCRCVCIEWLTGLLIYILEDRWSTAHACFTCPTAAPSAQCQALPACGATPFF